jgi:3-hydroxyacyl-CoA dehydrogenase/3-hydroxy-2-methylbutyryl-CoA dehydrogenase
MKVLGKTAIVTGGGSGLGRATCEELAAHGARLVVVDRDERAARQTASALGDGAIAVGADVTDEVSIAEAIATATGTFGALHICVNCAGVVDGHKIVQRGEPAPLAFFTRVVTINLTGTFNVMRLAVAAMLINEPDESGERGVVVNTASVSAFEGQIGQVAYSASKAGVVGMTLPVARDLAGTGVRVNSIAPGLFKTAMLDGMPANVQESLTTMVTEPARLGNPAEFAALARHIVENGYLNGTCIRLDAGTRLAAR